MWGTRLLDVPGAGILGMPGAGMLGVPGARMLDVPGAPMLGVSKLHGNLLVKGARLVPCSLLLQESGRGHTRDDVSTSPVAKDRGGLAAQGGAL